MCTHASHAYIHRHITHITDITDITEITEITGITEITDIAHIIDIAHACAHVQTQVATTLVLRLKYIERFTGFIAKTCQCRAAAISHFSARSANRRAGSELCKCCLPASRRRCGSALEIDNVCTQGYRPVS